MFKLLIFSYLFFLEILILNRFIILGRLLKKKNFFFNKKKLELSSGPVD